MNDKITRIEQRLQGSGAPLIIDGGTGTRLEQLGAPMHERVWSAYAVLSHPEVVRQAHADFIEAGAEVIITNTFAAARHMLEPGGLGEQVDAINRNAVRLAREAAAAAGAEDLAIAGSICEWTYAENTRWNHAAAVRESVREQAGLLAEAGVDLIALEMCENVDLTSATIESALETGLPLWIGVSARSFPDQDRLSVFDFETGPFEDLAKLLTDYPAMVVNVMHTPVPDVPEAMRILRQYWSGPLGVYPESGYFEMPNWNFVDIIEPDELVAAARGWVDDGARLLGGCCGLGPEHVAALRGAFNPPSASA